MNLRNLVRILVALMAALIVIGMTLVLSASSTYSALKFDSIYYMFNNHIVRVVVAALVFLLFSIIPYETYKKLSKPLLLGILVTLFLTFLLAARVKGANRWINFYLFTFQPSAAAKIILIIHLAYLIEKKGEWIKNYKQGFIYPLVWIMIIAGLVLIQPNVSTSIIIMVTSFAILFVGGAKLKHILLSMGGTGLLGLSAVMIFPHSRGRVMDYISSLLNGGNLNHQVHQAKIALGSGGLWGVGLGHSRQSDLFIPEAYGDFIFSVLGEEMGFIGAVVVLFVFLAIFFIGLIIAKNTPDTFGQLLAFGLTFNVAVSAFINAAVVLGLLPTTGITLPFISYGGTSIVFMCASIGIITNIALKTNRKREARLASA